MNNGFAFCFKAARLSTTFGNDFEGNKFCGQIATVMKVITNIYGDLFSQFDNNNENDITILERIAGLPPHIRSSPQQKMLINKHTDVNKGKIKGYLNLEDNFGFCKSFKKVTKNLGFHVMFKTNDFRKIIYTTTADDKNVTINIFVSVCIKFNTIC